MNTLIQRRMSQIVFSLLPRHLRRDFDKLKQAYTNFLACSNDCIPVVLISALIAAEDHRFFLHSGVDPLAICRAIFYSCRRGSWFGGSTLEQQLVRTLSGRKERSILRKLGEVAQAFCVCLFVPKRDVPGLYLSVAYFGWKMNGILQTYSQLGIAASSMTELDAAGLVARLKYPQPNNPSVQRWSQISRRQDYILWRLATISERIANEVIRVPEGEALSYN